MDAAKKATLEKRIVLALLAVFLVTFAADPLRHLGLSGRSAPPGPPPAESRVNIGKPLGQLMQEHWNRMDPQASVEVPGASQGFRPPSPAYTAQDLRDPLRDLLPAPAEPADGVTERLAEDGVAAVPSEGPPPPPDLRVQGLLWGGVEPKAIINDQVYGINDVIAGSKIIAIDRRGVTIDHGGTPVFYPPSSAPRQAGVSMSPPSHQWR